MADLLASAEAVQSHLNERGLSVASVTPLSGGSANFVYRVALEKPYADRKVLILKFAAPYIASQKDMDPEKRYPLDVQRQKFEVEALRRVQSLISKDSIVVVPTVHLFDEENRVILMDDIGERGTDLKTFGKKGLLTVALGEEIGNALGEFLARLHKWGEEDVAAKKVFVENEVGKKVAAWRTYGRLVPTLIGSDGRKVLQHPSMKLSEETLAIFRKVEEEKTAAIYNEVNTIDHGDFWPGNIIVTLKDDGKLEQLYILDWELTKTGVIGLDLGQLCAELQILGDFTPKVKEATSTLLKNFLDTYQASSPIREDIARVVLTHWAGHLITMTPILGGDEDMVRKTVLDGVEKLLTSVHSENLSNTVVGQLVH